MRPPNRGPARCSRRIFLNQPSKVWGTAPPNRTGASSEDRRQNNWARLASEPRSPCHSDQHPHKDAPSLGPANFLCLHPPPLLATPAPQNPGALHSPTAVPSALANYPWEADLPSLSRSHRWEEHGPTTCNVLDRYRSSAS